MVGTEGLVLVEMETAFLGTHTPSENLVRRGSLHPCSTMSEGWWEVLVTLQFVASDFVLRHPIYRRAAGSFPGGKAEVGRKEERRKSIHLDSRQAGFCIHFSV